MSKIGRFSERRFYFRTSEEGKLNLESRLKYDLVMFYGSIAHGVDPVDEHLLNWSLDVGFVHRN